VIRNDAIIRESERLRLSLANEGFNIIGPSPARCLLRDALNIFQNDHDLAWELVQALTASLKTRRTTTDHASEKTSRFEARARSQPSRRLLARNLLAFRTGLGESNCDGLLFRLNGLAASTALERASLSALHSAFDVAGCRLGISSHSLFLL
jgi:hypothetical protein